MLDVTFGQASDPGKVRTNNEDAMGIFFPNSRHLARSHGYLYAVADGVGGMDLGEVASSMAISVLTEEFEKGQSGAMLISLLPAAFGDTSLPRRPKAATGRRNQTENWNRKDALAGNGLLTRAVALRRLRAGVHGPGAGRSRAGEVR